MLLVAAIICEILACAEVDIFIPSFPELQQTFNLTPFMVQLTVSMNFLSYCVMTLFVGPLSDRYGRKKLMMYGLWCFLGGSVFCSFASSFPMLLCGRFLQGLGMAAPATLAYVVIADHYSKEEQVKMLGILNGVVSASLAFAPVVGSFINMYHGWRGNFIVLLMMGLVALFMCTFFIPEDQKRDEGVSLSLTSYLPLLRSPIYMRYFYGIVFLIVAFWTFIGMGPIVYMEGMGIPIHQFGFYQGTVAGAFCVVSFLSPMIMNKFGQIKCFKVSTCMLVVFASLLGLSAVFLPDMPILITALMALFGIFFVFPINVLWPASLEVVPDTKARASALMNVGRLIGTALSLEGVSYLYTGQFFHTGIFIFGASLAAVYFFAKTPEWQSVDNEKTKDMAA